MPARIYACRVLAGMTINGLPFLLLGIGNVYEVGWVKPHRLLTGANFKKVQHELIRRPHPGLYGKQTGALMVLMRVDRPMAKYNVGVFLADQTLEMLQRFIAYYGIAIDLTGKHGFAVEYPAGIDSLLFSYPGGLIMTDAIDTRFTGSQINNSYFMPHCGQFG